jgi:hypothetical protein
MNRNTIDTYYDNDKEVDIEIETTYDVNGRPKIKITAYKGGVCVCEFNADHMDRYFLDELELDDEG